MIRWPDDCMVLIPAYRAAASLRTFLPELLQSVPRHKICVIDDASGDATGQICREFNIAVISHKVNRGKGAALSTGFDFLCKSGYRWIISMDADGQHSPEDLPRFIAAISSVPPPGICIGARSMKPGTMPPARIFSNVITSRILSLLCGIPILDSQCGYRLYNTAFLREIHITCHRFEMESELIMKAAFLGFPVTFTPVQTVYLKGPSHISHFFDTLRWISAVIRIRMQRKRIVNRRQGHEP